MVSDFRYDLAWASFLIFLHQGDDKYEEFCGAYWQEAQSKPDDGMRAYELIAALRWKLLHRLVCLTDDRVLPARLELFVKG